MKNLLLSTSLLLALVLGSCNQKPAEEKKAEATPAPAKIELRLADLGTDKDLYCDMPLEEGAIADTATYEGKVYGFCSKECKAEFLKDPATLVAKLKK
jgi:YHS domain-containing protein